MSRIKLYIATTIDGYIARENNSLDWLYELPQIEGEDYGYANFYSGIDVVVLGRTTYEEILGFGVDWPYSDSKCFVITSNKNYQVTTENTEVMNSIDKSKIDKIRSASNKGVWIVGGGPVIQGFLNEASIDEMLLTIIPRLLGRGKRLFPEGSFESKFELLESKSFETGVVNLTYRKLVSE